MPKNDAPTFQLADIPAALGLLTRLPVSGTVQGAASRGARAAWAYPLAGLAVGLGAGIIGGIALWLGLPAALAALLALAAQIALTGAMHEEGLANAVGGLWGGQDRARRLEIMKDGTIGVYGVLALIMSVGARWAALWLLFEVGCGAAIAAMIAGAALSRAALPAVMWGLPHAQHAGRSYDLGRPDTRTLGAALAVAALLAILALGWAGIGALFWAGLATLIMGGIAQARIRGQTGDILGAAQQAAEIAVLMFLVA